jgi:hypothetical protein
MLQIKIANQYFDIPDDIQVPISVINPLVSDSGFNEIFTYTFNLQASPRNRSLYNRYVNKGAKITLSFQSHVLATGVAQMKMDSNGIAVMIKNDALNLRQQLENLTFEKIRLPIIPICEVEDTPIEKIEKWHDFMTSKLPENEPWNVGEFKFTPIFAAPALQWAVSEDDSQREINPTMWDNGFPINAYDLATGQYISNYGIALPGVASFKILLGAASSISGGEYFIFNSANNVNKYYCWFRKDGTGVDPAPSGRTGITVNILTGDSSVDVATKTGVEIGYLVNDFEINDFGTGILQINNVQGGLTDVPSNINVGGSSIFDVVSGSGSAEDANNNWRTTVAPTLRLEYLLQEIAKYFKLNLMNDFLEQTPEFKALIHYAGKGMDMREDADGFQYNVHGLEIDLNEFKPNTPLIQLFKVLRHLFGVAFNYQYSFIKIAPVNIDMKPLNVSKFCMPQFLINELENKSIRYTYNLGTRFWEYGDFFALTGETGKFVNYYHDAILGEGKEESEEIPFAVLVDNNSVPTSLKWPDLAKSKVYNENDFESATQFQLGLFRGNFEVQYSIAPPFVPPSTSTANRLICFNQNRMQPNEAPFTGQEVLNYANDFGTCSIYANSEDSYLSVYANFLNKLKLFNQEIEKNLNLPFQNIIEIMRWKNPVHAIQQRNASFHGIVKELKFTLGKSTISPATITYLVNKNVATGDFNADFNSDFNS